MFLWCHPDFCNLHKDYVGSELKLQYYVGFNFIPPPLFFFFQICNRLSMLLSFAKCYFPMLIWFVLLVCITFLLKHAFLCRGVVYNRGWALVGRRGQSSSYSGSPSPCKVCVCYFLFQKRILPTRYLTLLILSNYNSYLGDQGVVAWEGSFYLWMVSLLFV